MNGYIDECDYMDEWGILFYRMSEQVDNILMYGCNYMDGWMDG